MADVPAAVLSATTDLHTREAMLLGSYLEGGWGPTYGVGDSGTSFGPYQMHIGGALTAAGLSPAQAENAVTATHAMLPAYQRAVSQISASLWQTNPEQAAESAAQLAERPAQSYYASQGAGRVNQAWSATQAALSGQSSSSGSSTTTTSTSIIGDILSGVFPVGSLFGGLNLKGGIERIGLVIFGGLLILAGIIIFALPAVTGAGKIAAQSTATGRAFGLASAGRKADIERRQGIADRSLALGEKKLAIQQQRENRLAARPRQGNRPALEMRDETA